VKAALDAALPGVPVSLSSRVAPEMREFERASTTAANAYVQPLLGRYLGQIESSLATTAPHARLFVMLSSGGLASSSVAQEVPVQLVESGPAAGALAACRYAASTGHEDLIAFDLGGTTAKMCVIADGRPALTHETEVARRARFKRGSGIPLLVPTVHLIEIGAGGGSIARADRLGLLKVGPESAGADPGPACYGLGGDQATVTDANLMLGYLDENAFLGGRMQLDRERAGHALELLGRRLGISGLEAARGVHDLVNENMAIATRRHVTEQARDPAQHVLVALGGGGPLHATGLARRLGIRTVICPPAAGAASALGCLVAPATIELARSHLARIDTPDWERLTSLYAELEEEARAALASAGVEPSQVRIRRWADARYVGQGFEVPVEIPDAFFEKHDSRALHRSFSDVYRARFSRALEEVPVECTTWRLTAHGPEGRVDLAVLASRREGGRGTPGRRSVHFAEAGGFVDCLTVDRYSLAPGDRLEGPAIVQEHESAAVVDPGSAAVVDDSWNLVITLA
ncbi:MAG: hydantoinase/oxoprolinase family protein, partial [Candidatus Woesearchaeota archaeon]